MPPKISPAEACEHIRQSNGAFLVLFNYEEIPTIGQVDPSDRKMECYKRAYEIGSVPDEYKDEID